MSSDADKAPRVTRGIAASAVGAYHHYECDLFLHYTHRPPGLAPGTPFKRPPPTNYTKETYEKGNIFEADLKATLKTLKLDPMENPDFDESIHPGVVLARAQILCFDLLFLRYYVVIIVIIINSRQISGELIGFPLSLFILFSPCRASCMSSYPSTFGIFCFFKFPSSVIRKIINILETRK